MRTERHERFEQMIDRSLAGAGRPEEEISLEEHVGACAACQEYLSVSRRAIAGLKGFSFEAGLALNAKVAAAIRLRAEQMEGRKANVRRWVGMSVLAVVLTLVGSVVDLRVGHMAAAFFDLRPMEVRQGLLALWIVPSFGLLLLFPILPLLSAKRYGKGRTI
jgi:predicted anti-sigma-YlaC factor YlaD